MANRPKSAQEHALAGYPGNRKPRGNGVKLAQSAPKPPRNLDAEAKREWKRVSSELLEAGLLTAVDRAALAAYCAAWSRWRAAEKIIQREGMTFTTERGYVQQHPAVGIANTALTTMRQFLVEFGMTPGSRAKVTASAPADDDEDFFAVRR
jgi:P27 family predicted phage terminase small subunit